MPSLETPPSPAQSPDPPNPPVKVRTGRYGELEEHELIHLLDSLDDERAKARFREAIYISVIFYLAVGWFLFLWAAGDLSPAAADQSGGRAEAAR